jgi:hypothetical protein
VTLTSLSLAATSRAFVGQPLHAHTVRFVQTLPWVDQFAPTCQIDGTPASIGDRVLLTAQIDPTQNGIFTLQFTDGSFVGFFNLQGNFNYRAVDNFRDGDLVFATDGANNRGFWFTSLGSPWAPDRTPIFFWAAPKSYGLIQRLIRFTSRVMTTTSSASFGQPGVASGIGVRFSQILGATARAFLSLFVAPPVRPPPPPRSKSG